MMIYIAGKYTAKERLLDRRNDLRRLGYTVLSTWMDQPETDYVFLGNTEEEREARKHAEAERDIAEVMRADVLVIDTFDESNTGGREVELGMALAVGSVLIRIGPERNIFHAKVDNAFDTWEEALDWFDRGDVKRDIPDFIAAFKP